MSSKLASLFLLLPSPDTGAELWMGARCVRPRSVIWPELLPESQISYKAPGHKWDFCIGAHGPSHFNQPISFWL